MPGRTDRLYDWGMAETTYTKLRQNLAKTLDKVVDDQETVIVRRKDGRDVALLPADQLASMMETLYQMRSPRNMERLDEAIREADAGGGVVMTVEELRKEFGLERG